MGGVAVKLSWGDGRVPEDKKTLAEGLKDGWVRWRSTCPDFACVSVLGASNGYLFPESCCGVRSSKHNKPRVPSSQYGGMDRCTVSLTQGVQPAIRSFSCRRLLDSVLAFLCLRIWNSLPGCTLSIPVSGLMEKKCTPKDIILLSLLSWSWFPTKTKSEQELSYLLIGQWRPFELHFQGQTLLIMLMKYSCVYSHSWFRATGSRIWVLSTEVKSSVSCA